MVRINHPKFMDIKLFKLVMIFIFIGSLFCQSEEHSDKQLLEIAQQAFAKRIAEKNENLAIEAIREGMVNLSDAEKTRAMALRIFDLDEKDHGRMRSNAPSSVEHVLMDDPSLITDSTELKRMIANENDARRFYILSAMAVQLMNSHNGDFVVEISPMLFRHEPLATTNVDSEYYNQGLTDASFGAYGLIVKNLQLLNANFVPPDDKIPYAEKIPILVKWLKANWAGCENLGEKATSQGRIGVKAAERSDVRQEKRIFAPTENQSSMRTSSSTPWWQICMAAIVLILVFGTWFKLKYPSDPP